MNINWLSNGRRGSALMGEVIDESENYYTVKVISYESKSGKKYMGRRVLVNKKIAQIVPDSYC